MRIVKGVVCLVVAAIVACAPQRQLADANRGERMVMATTGASVPSAAQTSPPQGLVMPTPALTPLPQATSVVEIDAGDASIASVATISILFAEEGAIGFSVSSSVSVLPNEGVTVQVRAPTKDATPSLFKRQTHQYGQFEKQDANIAKEGNQFAITVKATGDFLFEPLERGIEDTIPSIPTAQEGFVRFPQEEAGYGVQSLSEIIPLRAGTCAAPRRERLRFYDSEKRWYLEFGGGSVREYTYDATFPNKPIVVMVHGGGSEFRSPRYHRFANYTRHVKEDMAAAAVRENIAQFVPYGWITRDSPLRAASVFQGDVRACIDAGTPIMGLTHSLGGFMAAAAHVSGDPLFAMRSLGFIALGTPWGGTQLGLLEAIQEEMTRDYEAEKLYGITVGLLLDYGAIDASYSARTFVSFRTGKSFSLLNEGWRSSTFNGRWTGIPTRSYDWYSARFPERGRYLPHLLAPTKRFTTPCYENPFAPPPFIALGSVATYMPEGASQCYYNFAEGLSAELNRLNGIYTTPFRRQPVDIIAGYFSGKDIPEKREAFLAKFRGIRQVITYAALFIPSEKEKLEEESLPFLASVLGLMASDMPMPNANAVTDGIARLEGPLKDGESILGEGSTVQDIRLNETAYQARKPVWARKMAALKDVTHAQLIIGDPGLLAFAAIDQSIIERLEPLRAEERATVFTSQDEDFLEDGFFPDSAPFACDAKGSCAPKYGVYIMKKIQDPDKRNEKNRMRLTLRNNTSWIYGDGTITIDMVKRLGVWRVLVPSSPTQPSTNN